MLSADAPASDAPAPMKTTGIPTAQAAAFAHTHSDALETYRRSTRHYGNRGLYVVAALAGLTDVDAITLSTVQLVNAGRLNADDGWRLVVMAAVSNLIFKAGAVAALGRRQLFVRILPAYGIVIAAGILMLLYQSFAFWNQLLGMANALVLGGGFAGVVAAESLAQRLGPEHRITLVSRHREFTFFPSLVRLAFGSLKLENTLE
jgi:hypothetical protein